MKEVQDVIRERVRNREPPYEQIFFQRTQRALFL